MPLALKIGFHLPITIRKWKQLCFSPKCEKLNLGEFKTTLYGKQDIWAKAHIIGHIDDFPLRGQFHWNSSYLKEPSQDNHSDLDKEKSAEWGFYNPTRKNMKTVHKATLSKPRKLRDSVSIQANWQIQKCSFSFLAN